MVGTASRLGIARGRHCGGQKERGGQADGGLEKLHLENGSGADFMPFLSEYLEIWEM